jgi:periplasmic divalent cation tolerance protein
MLALIGGQSVTPFFPKEIRFRKLSAARNQRATIVFAGKVVMSQDSNIELVVAFSTAGSPEEARHIATALVTEQLAASVNIIDNIHSIYRWEGAVESAAESLMLINTRAKLLPAIELRLRELHSYDVPELVAIPIGQGAQPYLDWLLASTGDSQKSRDHA